jgi:tetratricopeptide (TPR) repeat protein
LEKRIGELEEVPSNSLLNGSDHPGAPAIGHGAALSALIGKGQGLMKKAAALERLVCYDPTLAIRPDFTQAQLAKASVLNQLERFTEALNCFKTAIKQQRASA